MKKSRIQTAVASMQKVIKISYRWILALRQSHFLQRVNGMRNKQENWWKADEIKNIEKGQIGKEYLSVWSGNLFGWVGTVMKLTMQFPWMKVEHELPKFARYPKRNL